MYKQTITLICEYTVLCVCVYTGMIALNWMNITEELHLQRLTLLFFFSVFIWYILLNTILCSLTLFKSKDIYFKF